MRIINYQKWNVQGHDKCMRLVVFFQDVRDDRVKGAHSIVSHIQLLELEKDEDVQTLFSFSFCSFMHFSALSCSFFFN